MKLKETLEALEKSTKDLTKSVEEAKPVEDDAKPEGASEATETAEASKEAEPAKPETPAEAPTDDTSEAKPAGDESESENEPEAQAGESTETEVEVSEDKADEPGSPVEAAPADDTHVEAEQATEPSEKTEKSFNIDRDLVMKSLDTLNLALDVIKSMSKPESRQDDMSKHVVETPDAKHKEDANGGKQSPVVVKGTDCDDPDMKDGKKKDKVSKDDDDDDDDEVVESATKSADKDGAEECDDGDKMSDDKKKDKEDDATKSVTGKAVQSDDAEDAVEKSEKADKPSKEEIIKSFRNEVSEALEESDSDVMAGPNSARSNRLREVLSEANKSTELSDTLKKSFLDIN